MRVLTNEAVPLAFLVAAAVIYVVDRMLRRRRDPWDELDRHE